MPSLKKIPINKSNNKNSFKQEKDIIDKDKSDFLSDNKNSESEFLSENENNKNSESEFLNKEIYELPKREEIENKKNDLNNF